MEETKAKTIETMLAVENRQEVEELMEILKILSPNEKRDFYTFMQAIRFLKTAE